MMQPEELALHDNTFIHRLGVVTQVRLKVENAVVFVGSNVFSKDKEVDAALPVQFSKSLDWQLTHRCPTTGDWVEWNWDLKSWFGIGNGMSTYGFRDKKLLAAIASLFTCLELHHEESRMGVYDDYRLMSSIKETMPPLMAEVPRLHYYRNAAHSAQFLSLYNEYRPVGKDKSGIKGTVFIHEIVQVAMDEDAFHQRIMGARQAAIHYSREISG